MGAGHTHPLYLDRASAVHRLPPEVKITATVVFTVAVVVTPREAFWAFGVYTLILAAVAALARVPAGWLAKRSLIELPFVALAVLLPFLAVGDPETVAGGAMSRDELYAVWNNLAKDTLAFLASQMLEGTTTIP